jgi:hypothetical protein
MSILGLVRIASLVSGMLICAVVVAAQAAPPNPGRFVTSIYANGREADVWVEWRPLNGASSMERTTGEIMNDVPRPEGPVVIIQALRFCSVRPCVDDTTARTRVVPWHDRRPTVG